MKYDKPVWSGAKRTFECEKAVPPEAPAAVQGCNITSNWRFSLPTNFDSCAVQNRGEVNINYLQLQNAKKLDMLQKFCKNAIATN